MTLHDTAAWANSARYVNLFIYSFIYFIYLFAEEQRANLYNHTVYKNVLIQQDLEGREHLI